MSEFEINNSINVSKWNQIITFLVSKIKIAWKWAKKGDFENPKVINRDFSTKSVPEKYGFLNSTVPWGRKNSTIWGPPVQPNTMRYEVTAYSISEWKLKMDISPRHMHFAKPIRILMNLVTLSIRFTEIPKFSLTLGKKSDLNSYTELQMT